MKDESHLGTELLMITTLPTCPNAVNDFPAQLSGLRSVCGTVSFPTKQVMIIRQPLDDQVYHRHLHEKIWTIALPFEQSHRIRRLL